MPLIILRLASNEHFRHTWGERSSSHASVAQQAPLYGERNGSRGVSGVGIRGAANAREAGERTWRREGFDERQGGVLEAGTGNRKNPFKTARELRAAVRGRKDHVHCMWYRYHMIMFLA